MKITIENTDKIVLLSAENGNEKGTLPARVWEGETDSGIPIICYMTRIQVAKTEGIDHSQFERELSQCREPSREAEAIPIRLIL